MRPINLIVIHCSASPNGHSLFKGMSDGTGWQVTPVREIDRWHYERGFRRTPQFRKRQNPDLAAIGYHFVVYTNGAIATGRHEDEIGAHVQGFNQKSLGICMVGTDRFTPDAWRGLADLLAGLKKRYPDAAIMGHRDLSPDKNGDGLIQQDEWLKICPGFEVAKWISGGMKPLSDHLCEEA
jgi:N-acetyl-anhydromuramyl-L-alanine amidase AmpD